jgi:outer membrane usher protein
MQLLKRLYSWIGIFLSLPAISLCQLNEEDLFQKVFGQREIQKFMAPLIVNRVPYDFVLVSLPHDDILFESGSFLMVLKDNADLSSYNEVLPLVDDNGYLKASSLKNLDYDVVFDTSNLALAITIPPDKRLSKDHVIAFKGRKQNSNIVLPSTFSAYLNIALSQSYRNNSQTTPSNPFLPFAGSFKGIVNFRSVVWENFFNYKDRRSYPLQHTDQRIIYDNTSKMWRITLGDVAMRTAGFAASSNIGGISLSKDFGLQPYSVTTPVHEHEIFLDHPSKVEIYVNNNKTRTLTLGAGPHNLIDFPAMLGSNDVEIKIIDEFGEEHWVDFPFIHETNLLKPGLQRYSYNFGFEKKLVKGHIEYDSKEWVFSMFHEAGINDNYTLGGYLQANRTQFLGGMTGIWAVPIGRFGVDIAGSIIHDTIKDFAANITYNNYDSHDLFSDYTTITCNATYYGRRFALLGEEDPDNNIACMFSTSLGKQLADEVNASLGGSFEINRKKHSVPYRFFLGLGKNLLKNSKRFWHDLDVSTNFSYARKTEEQDEFSFYFNASWRIPYSNHSISTNYDSQTSSKTINWTYAPQRIQSYKTTYSGHLAQNTSSKEAGLDYGYSGHRGNIRLSADTNYSDSSASTTNSASVFVATAIAFIDGHIGISRPISNSFAILAPNKKFKGRTIYVNPNETTYLAKSNGISSAIISNLSAYQPRSIYVDVPDLPIGYDIGHTSFTLMPTNKSGSLVTVGTDSTVFLSCILINDKGIGISMQAGQLIPLDKPTQKPIIFFTNKTGKFRTLGISSGKYRLQFFSSKFETFHFEIPENCSGLYNLGENIIKTKEY